MNSSGSVLKIFENQVKNGGPLTVTDKNATRFFMSIPEAAQLIIQSSAIILEDHQIYILDMGKPYNIYSLAKKIIKINGFKVRDSHNDGIEIKIIGLQKGEKIDEELVINKELLTKTDHPKINSTSENYAELDIEDFVQSLQKLYSNNNTKLFKDLINKTIDSHLKVN